MIPITAARDNSISKIGSNGFFKDYSDGAYFWKRHIEYLIRDNAFKKEFSVTYQFQALYSIDIRTNDFTKRMKRGKEILKSTIAHGEWLGYHIRLIDESNDWQPYIIIDWS